MRTRYLVTSSAVAVSRTGPQLLIDLANGTLAFCSRAISAIAHTLGTFRKSAFGVPAQYGSATHPCRLDFRSPHIVNFLICCRGTGVSDLSWLFSSSLSPASDRFAVDFRVHRPTQSRLLKYSCFVLLCISLAPAPLFRLLLSGRLFPPILETSPALTLSGLQPPMLLSGIRGVVKISWFPGSRIRDCMKCLQRHHIGHSPSLSKYDGHHPSERSTHIHFSNGSADFRFHLAIVNMENAIFLRVFCSASGDAGST